MRGQKQKYPVVLSEQDAEQLTNVLKPGEHSTETLTGANTVIEC